MIPVLSRDQIRALDRHAMEACGVSGLVLMENAGRGAAEIIETRARARPGPIVVVCGAGNNGGDGFVVARRLAARGFPVRVFFAGSTEGLPGDAGANRDAWIRVGGTVENALDDGAGLTVALKEAAIVVDALLGTGLSRPVSGRLQAIILEINRAPGLRVALDIPSGLDANTGQPLGLAVLAHETITFAHYKLGLLTSQGADHAGRVTVADIGVPGALSAAVGESALVLEPRDVGGWIAPRKTSVHKGAAGRVVAVAGSPGKTGAALLVARGALRAGAGLVTICTFPDAADALDRRVLEEMTARIDVQRLEGSLDDELENVDAVVLGPGLGLFPDARRVVDHVAFAHEGFVVIDADALSLLSGRLEVLRSAKGPRALTPHPGELGRLLGISAAEVEADRFGAVARAVELSHCTVLLKGARTLIGTQGALTVVNPSGSPVLAIPGSGDVLSGVVAALYCAVRDAARAACAAAYLHGRAGERWANAAGTDRGLLAHEVADGIPSALAELTGASLRMPD